MEAGAGGVPIGISLEIDRTAKSSYVQRDIGTYRVRGQELVMMFRSSFIFLITYGFLTFDVAQYLPVSRSLIHN